MDLRIERTYRLLIEAFTNLLEESSYDNITVAALCERAMIRRTTFYKHFADKDEFFTFYLKSIRDEFVQRVGNLESCDFDTRCKLLTKELLRFLREHERLTDNAINSSNSGLLFDALYEVMFNDSLRFLKNEAETQHANNVVKDDAAQGNGDNRDINAAKRTGNGRAAKGRAVADDFDLQMKAAFSSGGIMRMALCWWGQGHPRKGEKQMLAAIGGI